jgi:hypothetical protein
MLWPYPADAIYFRALAFLSGLCALTVFVIEVYGIWFVVFASDIRDRDTFGILGRSSGCSPGQGCCADTGICQSVARRCAVELCLTAASCAASRMFNTGSSKLLCCYQHLWQADCQLSKSAVIELAGY